LKQNRDNHGGLISD
jgi:hypothetical protein